MLCFGFKDLLVVHMDAWSTTKGREWTVSWVLGKLFLLDVRKPEYLSKLVLVRLTAFTSDLIWHL